MVPTVRDAVNSVRAATADEKAQVLAFLAAPDGVCIRLDEAAEDDFLHINRNMLLKVGIPAPSGRVLLLVSIAQRNAAAPAVVARQGFISFTSWWDMTKSTATTVHWLYTSMSDRRLFHSFWVQIFFKFKQAAAREPFEVLICGSEPDNAAYRAHGILHERIFNVIGVEKYHLDIHVNTRASDKTAADMFVCIVPKGEQVRPLEMYKTRTAIVGKLVSRETWLKSDRLQELKVGQASDRFFTMHKEQDHREMQQLGYASSGPEVRALHAHFAAAGEDGPAPIRLTYSHTASQLAWKNAIRARTIVNVRTAGLRELVYLHWKGLQLRQKLDAAAEAKDNILRPGDIVEVTSRDFKVVENLTATVHGGVYKVLDEAIQPPRQLYMKVDAQPTALALKKHLCIVEPASLQAELEGTIAEALGKAAELFGHLTHGRVNSVWRNQAPIQSGLLGAHALVTRDLGRSLAELGSEGALDDATMRPVLIDCLESLAVLQASHYSHGDIKPDNLYLSAGRGSIGDLGAAVGPATKVLHGKYGIVAPRPDLDPETCAAAISPLFSSKLALLGVPLSLVCDAQALVLSIAHSMGHQPPWAAEAARGDHLRCINMRSHLEEECIAASQTAAAAAASSRTASTCSAAYLAQLPPILRQAVVFSFSRPYATSDDLLDLIAALKDPELDGMPLTPPRMERVRKRRLS